MSWWAGESQTEVLIFDAASSSAADTRAQQLGAVVIGGPFASSAAANRSVGGQGHVVSGGGGGGGTPPCKGSGAWNYNTITGKLERVPTVLGIPPIVLGIGWHRLSISYCATREQAIAEAKREFPSGPAPGGSIASNAVKDAAGSAGIGSFLARLTQANTWLRVAEVILGGALLLIGLAKLASNTAAGKAATRIATKAALL